MRKIIFACLLLFFLTAVRVLPTRAQRPYQEKHRPQLHFTPKAHWMNDPNGLVFYKGVYHLFFQYYPDSNVWGPNYWGHSSSRDLIHWTEMPPALAPDSLGLIASGSAVVDYKNTSGFGKKGSIPLVAIYAYINQALEKQNKYGQYQAIAYSLDETRTWTKYAFNPVVKNPGIKDFRDPKVIWYEPWNKWIMTVATHDHVTYYSSPDLKVWSKEGEFGKEAGAHMGDWECPDLIHFDMEGKRIWVQIVSTNPGGPAGGSATQYFVGDFDGKSFTPYHKETRWIDYGPDNYAGVTWSNTGERKIFLGWMSNWQYATIVPTEVWRSAMTIPRELSLTKVRDQYYLASKPVKELDQIGNKAIILKDIKTEPALDLSESIGHSSEQYRLDLTTGDVKNFTLTISNKLNQQVVIGYSQAENAYYIDRTRSGKTDFEKGFAKRFSGPRLSVEKKIKLTLIVDAASVELFADDGLTVMTAIFFPEESFDRLKIGSSDPFLIKELRYTSLKSIWDNE